MMITRMKSYRIQFVVLAVVGVIALPLRADVVPGRWEKVAALAMKSPITVELNNGDRVNGKYQGLSPSILELVTHSANAAIPKEDIKTITTRPQDDLLNGAIIGAWIGAGIMVAVSNKPELDLTARGALYFTAIGAAIGLGIGAVTDAVRKPVAVVLYEAPESR